MAEYDLASNVKIMPAINPASHADISEGISIDTKGYESVTFVVQSGALGAGTVDFVVQHADDNGSGAAGAFTNVTVADDIIGTIPTLTAAGEDNVARSFGYRGKKQWVRLQSVETSAWTTAIFGASCILSNPTRIPVA